MNKRRDIPNPENRSEHRVGGEDGSGVEQVRVDEVVEDAEEDEDHAAAEGGGADDRCDPRDGGGGGGPGEREEALRRISIVRR